MRRRDRSLEGRPGRLAMLLVGVLLLVGYAVAAYLAYRGLSYLWAVRPDPLTLLAALLVGTLVAGYLGYKVGTARLLAQLQAVPLTRDRAPRLHSRLDDLIERTDADRPELRVGSLPAPNALSLEAGESGVVVFDADLLRALSLDEVEAILAHELAHLERHDVLVQTMAYTALQTVVGLALLALLPITLLLTGLARGLAWAGGTPGAWADTPIGRIRLAFARAVMVVFAVVTLAVRARSRNREYAADERSATVTGNPLALASALRTIDRRSGQGQGLLSQLTIGGEDDAVTRLFATHPPTEDRVERLREMADQMAADRWTTIPVT